MGGGGREDTQCTLENYGKWGWEGGRAQCTLEYNGKWGWEGGGTHSVPLRTMGSRGGRREDTQCTLADYGKRVARSVLFNCPY